MTQINAYLTFDSNCREAMNFYKDCLGGELVLNTVAGSAMEAHCAPEQKDSILHATLTNGGLVLMASDNLSKPGKSVVIGSDITLSLNCSTDEEINNYFSKLAEGGEVEMPLATQFWGATFGMLKDKYGKTWMLNFDKPAQ